MRFPSLATLAARGREVLVRFPWTMAAGLTAAVAAIIAAGGNAEEAEWGRAAMVAALGLPLTIALTLLAEERRWSAAGHAMLNAPAVVLLIVFYMIWPGPEQKHETIRYFQLSAALHLLVAVLPFVGQRESNAFWQYNRRLFLGILRAGVFSFVLFVGLAIALGALDKLFGVNVPGETYPRLWFVVAFVVNTGIFLAAVPRDLAGLAGDTTYPKVLQVFAQYILTPLVFIYLVILLAYLVKILVGGEWPSGWIGWLVTSVAVAGLLGFLLIHPLRDDAGEGWIRTYTRWLFIGLIPAAVMLLLAFWKRILPYGLTEPRVLGAVLGVWLLATAVLYTMRRDVGIRRIPVTLAILLLITLYGPLSATRLSVASQGRRLERIIAAEGSAQEASAALRFLLEHRAEAAVSAAIPGELPSIQWDSVETNHSLRDSAGTQILAAAGMRYLPEYSFESEGHFSVGVTDREARSIAGFDWSVGVSSHDTSVTLVGTDSLSVRFDTLSSIVDVKVGQDSLRFDLRQLVSGLGHDSTMARGRVSAESLRLVALTEARRAVLALQGLNGRRSGDSVQVNGWHGVLLLGTP